MFAILELPEVRAQVLRWSVGDYERLAEQGVFGRRPELIRGIVIQKMPKSPLHCALAKWLYDRFQALLPNGFAALQERPFRLADSMPEPDVAVVLSAGLDLRATHPVTAELVVEVAVSSAALDRELASLYAEAGISEYWIVLAREEKVEVFRRPVDGLYSEHAIFGLEWTLECESVPAIRISVEDLFAP